MPSRYFRVTDSRPEILTYGKKFWFFSDIEKTNKMDRKPFFTFDLQALDDTQVGELARFQKTVFAMDAILEAASNLTRASAAAAYIKKQLAAPDDEFVRLVGRQIYAGSLTKGVIEELRPAIQAALDSVIRDRIQERLGVAFSPEPAPRAAAEPETPTPETAAPGDEVETTAEEQLAFMIVRAIGSSVAPVERITLRDAKSYCAVFMDDNNRRPVVRFYFNAKSVKAIGLFDKDKAETRHQIAAPADLYKFAGEIEAAVAAYA